MASVEDTTGRDTLLKASGLKSGKVLDIGMGGCACMSATLLKSLLREAGIAVNGSHPWELALGRQNECEG